MDIRSSSTTWPQTSTSSCQQKKVKRERRGMCKSISKLPFLSWAPITSLFSTPSTRSFLASMPYSSSPSLSTHEPNSNSCLSNSNYKPMLNSKKHKENYRVIPSTLLFISIPPVIDTGLHIPECGFHYGFRLWLSKCHTPSVICVYSHQVQDTADLVFLLLLSSKLINVKPHFIFNLFYFYF